MIKVKLLAGVLCAGLLCLSGPANAQKQGAGIDPAALAAAAKNCPGLKGVDTNALAAAINACPGLKDMDPAALVQAIQNCPGLNGQLPPGVAGCPALNGNLTPEQLAQLMAKCPALNANLPPQARNCPALNPGGQNCPALAGNMGPGPEKLAKKAEARMQKVIRALERNKKSADTLIQAAREAGADPNAIADLEKMSQAFRNVFMSVVSPQQIIENMLSQPAPQAPGTGPMILTAPDGTQWLVTPDAPQAPAVPPAGKGGFKAPRDQKPGRTGGFKGPGAPGSIGGGFHGGTQMAQPIPPQPPVPGMQPVPPQPGFQPAPVPTQPGINRPIPPQPGMQAPNQGAQNSMPQPEMIVIEEETQYMPLWPTKDDLGKDGVLKYLEKRQQALDATR